MFYYYRARNIIRYTKDFVIYRFIKSRFHYILIWFPLKLKTHIVIFTCNKAAQGQSCSTLWTKQQMNKKWWNQGLLKILGTLNENFTDSHVSKYTAKFTG